MAGDEIPKNGAPSPATGTVPDCPRMTGTKLAPYRDEIARLFGELDRRDDTIRELREEISRA